MKYRKLDNDGDYVFGHGDNDFLFDVDAVGQLIKTRLKLLLGEWWEDLEDGLPLFESILGLSGTDENTKAVDMLIQNRIMNTDGVTNIKKFSSGINKRVYDMQAVANTIYGVVEVSL